MSENEVLTFDSAADVAFWLYETGNCGLAHNRRPGVWIAIQFADSATWAFVAPDGVVQLQEW